MAFVISGSSMSSPQKMALAVSSVALMWQSQALAQQLPVIEQPQIEEVFVLGEFIPDEKRDNSEIANVLTAEDMAVLGDSEVAASLERVTGLSLVGGKFVYVRGLGERYSATFMNGSPISSPVPFQKTVPLDIVPNNLVGSLLVQKTYSAENSGDFSGGAVFIRTRAIPDEDYIGLTIKAGGNSESTDGDGLTYKGGQDDNTGYDDGTRDIPLNVAATTSEEFESTVFPERAALGASFYNNWDIRERKLDPDFEGSAEFGKRFDLDNGMAVGVTATGKYTKKWRNEDRDMRRYEFSGIEGGSTQTLQFQEFSTTRTIDVSGFLNVGWEISDDNSLSFTSMLLRQTVDEVEQRKGLSSEDDVSDGTPVESYFMQWTENEIKSSQISGEHYFPSLSGSSFNWRYTDGESSRDAPDTRSYTYAENRDGLQEIVTPNRQAAGDLREVYQAPDRNYSKQEDSISDLGLDFEVPFVLADMEIAAKLGGSSYQRTRDVEERLFRFDLTPAADPWIPLQTPQQLFGIDNWQSGAMTVRDFSAGAANASGIFPFASSKEEVDAYYGALDAQLTPRLRLQFGLRREDTKLEADAWGGNTEPGTGNAVEQEYTDTLPAVSATFEIVENMQIRFAYSETVNRPGLLEITGTTVRNPDDGNLYRGNVFLQPADLTNYDARWEWYFGDADEMSLGVFYKDFENPIEIGKVQAQNDIFTWFNAEEAELKGLEYDLRKQLYFGDWFNSNPDLNDFSLAFNISWIDSEVKLLGSDETAADVPLTGGRQLARLYANARRMTGQSDLLYNIVLAYDSFDNGLRGSLAYNFTGDRIALTGADSAPDIIEEGRRQLDFVLKYTFEMYNQDLEAEFKARNILDEEVEFTQGGMVYEKFKTGIDWSLGLTMRW
jgi:TonB-dependent receptor